MKTKRYEIKCRGIGAPKWNYFNFFCAQNEEEALKMAREVWVSQFNFGYETDQGAELILCFEFEVFNPETDEVEFPIEDDSILEMQNFEHALEAGSKE